jgi:hypothetical protein
MSDEPEQVPNELTPRDVAVALIAEKIAELRKQIEAHQKYTRNPGSYYHSRIRVFLEQCAVELRRAAIFLETTDQSED